MQFYVDFGRDSAVLGFSTKNAEGQQRFFPIYGSTYRGLPAVTLSIFASVSNEEMWVCSSWPGYKVLAYHRINTDRCMTKYGEIASFDKSTPDRLGGGTSHLPEMDVEKVIKIATFTYDKKRPISKHSDWGQLSK